MSHHCQACVVMCEDFRLHRRGRTGVRHQLARLVGGDYDLVTRAGAAQDLVRGPQAFAESLLRDIGVSVVLHGATTVFLVHHADCGAYGSFAFADGQQELRQHAADLHQAAQRIREKFPRVEVRLHFAALRAGSHDQYVPIPVEDAPPDGS